MQDHDHLNGMYRGASDSECNLAFKYQRFNYKKKNAPYVVHFVFHNIPGYDCHHLMSKIGKYKKRRLSCIANNRERFITFSLGGLLTVYSL